MQIIVKPQGERIQVLVRAPLEAMQDIDMPTFGSGYLDVPRAQSALEHAARLWLANDIELHEDGRRIAPLELVAARASIPSDRAFARDDTALAHILGPPLPGGTQLVWQQALLDVLLEGDIESEHARFAIRPRLERLGMRVVTAVRFSPPGGAERLFRVEGASEVIELDPRWHHAFSRFLADGLKHILDGIDHLLFLACLVLPFRRDLRALVLIVTAFTIGHSLTLLAAAFGLAPQRLWFPPLIETLIAASILYMALENIVTAAGASPGAALAARPGPSATVEPPPRAPLLFRWRGGIAAAFGLVHGFGFSFALADTMQFAGEHVVTSLLAFNLGIELGQLLVLVALVPLLHVAFRYVVAEKIGVIVVSAVVAHVAWHWMADRVVELRAYGIA